MNASGTLDPLAARDAGLEIDRELALVVTKTVTPLAREGNEAPRVCEVAGRDAQLDRPAQPRPRRRSRTTTLPAVRALGRPLVVSIGGFEHADYELACRRLDGEAGHRRARAQRLLPERQERLHLDRQRPRRDARRSCALCRAATRSAAVGQALAQRAPTSPRSRARPSAAAPTRSCSRTRCARSRSTTGRCEPLLGGITGGLSGPALKPVALAAVHTCREACALPIVGVGGIASGWDALEFLAAGASAVQVGSAAFREPLLARRVRDELATLLAERGPDGGFRRENNNTRLEVHVFPAPERVFCPLALAPPLMGCLRSADNDDRPEDPDPGTAPIARPAHGGAAPRERGPGRAGAAQARAEGRRCVGARGADATARVPDDGEGLRRAARRCRSSAGSRRRAASTSAGSASPRRSAVSPSASATSSSRCSGRAEPGRLAAETVRHLRPVGGRQGHAHPRAAGAIRPLRRRRLGRDAPAAAGRGRRPRVPLPHRRGVPAPRRRAASSSNTSPTRAGATARSRPRSTVCSRPARA